jgi:ribonuclease BN (tRNA processing enzyme)
MPEVLRTNPDVFTASVADSDQRHLGPFEVRQALVEHPGCWATRIGDALCYTADTAPCRAVDDLADGCAVLLAEASGLDADGPLRGGHLTAGDAGRLAARSEARLLILTHLRPWQDHAALLAEAAGVAGCPTILARPGLHLQL